MKHEINTNASAAGAAASAAAFVFYHRFYGGCNSGSSRSSSGCSSSAAPAAASVSEEKDSWNLNIINVLVFGKLVLNVGVTLGNFVAGAFIVAGGYSYAFGKLGEDRKPQEAKPDPMKDPRRASRTT